MSSVRLRRWMLIRLWQRTVDFLIRVPWLHPRRSALAMFTDTSGGGSKIPSESHAEGLPCVLMFRGLIPTIVGAILMAWPEAADAQTLPEIDVERLELNPSGAGSLVVGSGRLLAPGGVRLTGGLHYERNPLVVFRNDVR